MTRAELDDLETLYRGIPPATRIPELISLAREALELREALEYVANLRSAYWSRPAENKWRLIETDCGAMVIKGEGSTPLEAINNARRGRGK